RRRHTRWPRDWSSDVCSSDLFSLWVEKTALEMADAVIAVSGETKRDIERLFHVDPARVHVIHNGIDLNQYRKVDSTATLNRYDRSEERRVGKEWRRRGSTAC